MGTHGHAPLRGRNVGRQGQCSDQKPQLCVTGVPGYLLETTSPGTTAELPLQCLRQFRQ